MSLSLTDTQFETGSDHDTEKEQSPLSLDIRTCKPMGERNPGNQIFWLKDRNKSKHDSAHLPIRRLRQEPGQTLEVTMTARAT